MENLALKLLEFTIFHFSESYTATPPQNSWVLNGSYRSFPRYLHQLWIWLLCVCTSQCALSYLQIPSLFAALQFLLAPFDWIDLEGAKGRLDES